MCRGSKVVMVCGHGEARITHPCGLDCSNPRGPTTKLDTLCPRCLAGDPEQLRRDELMAQFLMDAQQTPAYSDSHLSPYAKPRTPRRTPWGSPWNQDSGEPDDDEGYLTDSGNHVIQKKAVSVNGHDAVISYRQGCHEVDPDLLLSLRIKREKMLAKERERERRRVRNGEDPMKGPMEPLLEERLREARERFYRQLSETPTPPPRSVKEYHQETADHAPEPVREPVRKPAAKSGRPPLRRMKRGTQVTRLVEENEESLDLWQTLADEYED